MPLEGAARVRDGIENAVNLDHQPDVREFPVMAPEAFIGLPGSIVAAPHTESDPTGLLLSAHTFLGNCIGRGPHYRVEATEHGTNMFVVKVGDSAKARKGTGEDRVLSFFRHADDEWANRRVHTGLSSGEGVIWEVRDAVTKMVRDKKSGVLIEETVDAGVDDKRLMIIESEFAGALRVMQREGNILSRILRDGWDRGNLATLTKNSPARATGSCISVIGHITATELRTYFDRTEMANGFGNRFLFACVRRSRFLPFGGTLADGDVLAIAYEIRRTIDAARSIRQVTMTPEAAEAWCAIYPDLSADRPGLLGSLTARAEAQVVRLAMLYALWAGSNLIALDHLMAAVAVEEFCRKSVAYIFGDMLGDQVVDAILDALRAAGLSGLTRTEISNLFSRHVSASQIARALGELARRGLAAQRKSDTTGGRPPEVWVTTRGERGMTGATPLEKLRAIAARNLSPYCEKSETSERTLPGRPPAEGLISHNSLISPSGTGNYGLVEQVQHREKSETSEISPDDAEERAALVEEGAGVPQTWAEGFAALVTMPAPDGFAPARWQRIIDATGTFLDKWTDTAIACGWTDLDMFGCDPDRPDARFDCMGLVLLLDRAEVVAVDEAGADLVTTTGARQRFRRRPLPPGTVSLWELTKRQP